MTKHFVKNSKFRQKIIEFKNPSLRFQANANEATNIQKSEENQKKNRTQNSMKIRILDFQRKKTNENSEIQRLLCHVIRKS